MPSAVVGLLRVLLTANTAEFKTEMAKASAEAKKFQREWSSIGKQVSGVGDALTKSISVPLLALGTGLVALGMKFDDAFDTIRAGTGATGDALKGLQQSFKNVLSTVPDDMQKVADAITEVHKRTGATGEGLETLTRQLLDLARLTKEDVGDLIASTTRMFGDWSIATDKQSESLDLLFRTSQQTGIGVSRLSELVVQFGAPLRALGFSFEEAAAMMGRFEKEGVNLETVMSGLKFALGAFAKAGKEPAEALQSVIAAIKDAKTESDAFKIAMEVFGKRAGPDTARAIREGRFEIGKLVEDLKNGKDTIKTAADETKGFAERFGELRNKIGVALEPLGTELLTALDNFVQHADPVIKALGDLAKGFNTLPEPVKNATIVIGLLGIALFPVISILGRFITVVANLVGAFAKGGLGARILAVVASLGGAGGLAGALGVATGAVVTFGAAFALMARGISNDWQEALTRMDRALKDSFWFGFVLDPTRAVANLGSLLISRKIGELTGGPPLTPPLTTPPAMKPVPSHGGTPTTPPPTAPPKPEPKPWTGLDDKQKELEAWNKEVDKLAAGFSGKAAIEQAAKLTEALTRAGGVAHMTTAEVVDLDKTLTDLFAKLSLAGPAGEAAKAGLAKVKDEAHEVATMLQVGATLAQASFDAQAQASKHFAEQFAKDQESVNRSMEKFAVGMDRYLDVLRDGEEQALDIVEAGIDRRAQAIGQGFLALFQGMRSQQRQQLAIAEEYYRLEETRIRRHYDDVRAAALAGLDPLSADYKRIWAEINRQEDAALDESERRFKDHVAQIKQEVKDLAKGVALDVAQAFSQFLEEALIGGGSTATQRVELGKQIGASIGAGIGAYFAGPIGAALGGAVGSWIGDAIAGGAGVRANDMRDQFLKQFGPGGTGPESGFGILAAQLAAIGQENLFKSLLRAGSEKEVAQAIERITDALERHGKELERTKQLTDELTAAQDELKRLQDSLTPSWERMEEIAQKFGIDVKGLGKQFQQLKSNAQFEEIINAWEEMYRGGADMGTVLAGMNDEIQKLVQESIKFGTTIPENMRPLIDELIRTGRLFDENGKKIEDISQIKFGPPIETQAEKIGKAIDALIVKIEELIDKLAKGIKDGAREGVGGADDVFRKYRPPTIKVPFEAEPIEWPEDLGPPPTAGFHAEEPAPAAATGGYVSSFGVSRFDAHPGRPTGTDTVPAWLTPGEWILNESQQRLLVSALQSGSAAMSALASQQQDGGGEDTGTTIVVIDGRGNTDAVAARVLSVMPRRTRRNEYEFRTKMREALGVT